MKRAYTKSGQPLMPADLRALEAMIDYYASHDGEASEEVIAARQALRNARELRARLVKEGRGHYVS